MIPLPILIGLGVTGAVAGSACVTAVVRTVRGEAFVRGRSHCDRCARPLSYAQTLPLISYVGLRGGCSACGSTIDPVYPVGELAGLVVVLSALLTLPNLHALPLIGMGYCLLASAVYDIRTLRLPDGLTVAVAVFGTLVAISSGVGRLLEGVVAATLTFAVLQGVRIWFERRRKEAGLGFGDVKLAAALAIWCGAAISWVVVAASVAGLIGFALVKTPQAKRPFGPYLAGAAWVVGLAQENLGSVSGLWTR